MRRFQYALLALSLFSTGFICGYLYKPVNGDANRIAVTDSGVDSSNRAINRPPTADHSEHDMQAMLVHASDVISQLESDNQALSHQIDQMGLNSGQGSAKSDLLLRIDRLPETLISQQLEMLFDDEYLEHINDKRSFAKQLVEIALADVESHLIETENDDNPYIEIEFSLSPVTGLRQFIAIADIEAYDTIFAHFSSATAYARLIVRWQHAGSGEILRMGPLSLQDNLNGFLSLKPENGWKPGYYNVSLFDINDNQKLVASSRYFIESISETESQAAEADQDVINDLISNGLAIPKSY